MKTYKVEISRTDYFSVEVEADGEAEARQAALDTICQADDPMGAFFTHSEGFDTEGCEEDEPEFGAATLAEHMADQEEITEACEAGECDHPECWLREEDLPEAAAALKKQNQRREVATILAALRLWQITPNAWRRSAHMEIATDGGEIEPLTAEEIDALCERINQ